jgi:hypothetical protein
MPIIEIDQVTYEKLHVTAQLTERQIGAVVKQLVDRLSGAPGSVTTHRGPEVRAEEAAESAWLPVFKVYKGNRVEGAFNPSTLELRITSGSWSGQVFASPTAAAIAVVERFSSDRVTPNTNGRKFWKLVASGRDLRSIVGER